MSTNNKNLREETFAWFKKMSLNDKFINYDLISQYPRKGKITGGTSAKYDIASAKQFNVMTKLGLREHHSLLDIGCGSLRGGRLFIPYLLPHNYYGIEPHIGLMRAGIEQDIGKSSLEVKQPSLSNDNSFNLSVFNQPFDFLLAQSIFSHATKAHIDKCFSEAFKVMHTDSIFAATFPPGSSDYEGDEWIVGRGIRYKIDTIQKMALKHGLKMSRLKVKHHNWNDDLPFDHYDQGQIWVTLKKN